MGFLHSVALLALLFITSVGPICGSQVRKGTINWFVGGDKTSEASFMNRRLLEHDMTDQDVFSKIRGKERVFEAQLLALIRSILEKGLPDLGIPPLDPLVYADNFSIGDIDMQGMITLEYLELGDFKVFGLSQFTVNSLAFDLPTFTATLNFTFPIEAQVNHSNFSIIVGDLIPFNGGGQANLNADLRIEVKLVLGRTDENMVIIAELSADIFFDTLTVGFSTLMGVTGGKQTHLFNKVIGDSTPDLINLMKPYMIDEILESIVTAGNKFLDELKFSYTDLINCLSGNDRCPFTLP